MASIRMTLGSILSTVSTTANAATGLLGAANDGISMLNASIAIHRKEQQLDHAGRELTMEERSMHKTTTDLAEITAEAAKYCSQSDGHKVAYSEARTRVEEHYAKLKTA